MKRLPKVFRSLLQRDRRSKTDIAVAAGLDVSLISRLSNRGNELSASALGRLARAFPSESDRLALLQAWLLDKAAEAGFDEDMAREALGAEGDLSIPPVLRDVLRELLRDVRGEDSPMVGLLQGLRDCLKESQDGEGSSEAGRFKGATSKPISSVRRRA